MVLFSRHLEEEKKAIQKLEGWHQDMVELQFLLNKGNWPAGTDSKSFAQYIAGHMCEDLLQSIQERKSHLTIVDHNPVSDSDTERIRANKRQLNQLDEQRIDSSSLNLAQSPTTARKKPQREDRNRRRTAGIRKTDKNSKEEQKLEDRNGIIMNQRIVPKETANDDGLKWRKYGTKPIRNEIHKKDYYKCASNGCPGKKTVQLVDGDQVRIVYYEVHNCGTQDPLVMQQQQQEEIGSDQNAGVLVNEAQPEQHHPQEMRHNVDLIPQRQQTPVIQQEDMMICQPNGRVLSSQIQVQREQQHDHSLQLQLQPPVVHNDGIGLQKYNVNLIPQFQQQQQQTPVIQQEAREDMMICQPNGGVLSSQIQVQREQQHDHSFQLQPPIVHNDGIGLQQYNVDLIPQFQQQQQQTPVIQQEACEDMMSCQPNGGVLSSQIQVEREQQHDHWPQLQPPVVHNDGIELEQYNFGLIPHIEWPPVDQYTQMFRSQSEPPTLDLWEHQR